MDLQTNKQNSFKRAARGINNKKFARTAREFNSGLGKDPIDQQEVITSKTS